MDGPRNRRTAHTGSCFGRNFFDSVIFFVFDFTSGLVRNSPHLALVICCSVMDAGAFLRSLPYLKLLPPAVVDAVNFHLLFDGRCTFVIAQSALTASQSAIGPGPAAVSGGITTTTDQPMDTSDSLPPPSHHHHQQQPSASYSVSQHSGSSGGRARSYRPIVFRDSKTQFVCRPPPTAHPHRHSLLISFW